ncbi:ABC transporter permease [Aliikangiella sp. IMCC44359]|uniref:ABC transporter permease n=1 Tax=Aliikangiella sp. IMCC44359 TaxID=3459125 RepID=UPI00403AFCC4
MEYGPIIKSLKHRKAFASLIILQVAITLTVMIISVLVTTSTLKEWNLPSGLDQQNIIVINPQIYDESLNLREVVSHDLDLLKTIPSIEFVTLSTQTPFAAEQVTNIYLENRETAQSFKTSIFNFDINGLNVLGLKVLQGRSFYETEIITSDKNQKLKPSVIMISQQMSEALFSSENPVGRFVYLNKNSPPVEIIGVYSNFMNGERLNAEGMSYRSIIYPQVEYINGLDPNYLVRVTPEQTDAILEKIRNQLYQIPGRFIQKVEFLTRTQKRMYDGRGSRALIMLFISFILLIITGLGISGLISYLVTQQKKQIGTRRALGAKKWQIIRYYLIENSIITWIGIFIGIIFSLILLILMSQENGTNIIHIGWILMIIVFVFIISIISALYPARKASDVEPAIVTRSS